MNILEIKYYIEVTEQNTFATYSFSAQGSNEHICISHGYYGRFNVRKVEGKNFRLMVPCILNNGYYCPTRYHFKLKHTYTVTPTHHI
jgi:hypothetical protein